MKISIAYSPDTDDAFMLAPLSEKLIDWQGFDFSFYRADIQELNTQALTKKFDISAISLAMYPEIQNEYVLLPVGSSIGDKFGPAIVVREDSKFKTVDDLLNMKVAVAGLQTSSFFAASIILPKFKAVPAHFTQIAELVKHGAVDAGILIHELQILDDIPGLRKIADLGWLWHQKFTLPLPLGGNAIRRDLPQDIRTKLTSILKESIHYAQSNRSTILPIATASSVKGFELTPEQANKYIEMYANDRSLAMQDDVVKAMELLLKSANQLKICKPLEREFFQ